MKRYSSFFKKNQQKKAGDQHSKRGSITDRIGKSMLSKINDAINDNVITEKDAYLFFKKACDEDNYDNVKKYLHKIDSAKLNDEFLELCKNDELEIINIILSGSDKISKETKYKGLVLCCKHGYIHLIEKLIETGIDLKTNDHEALKIACLNNRIDAVKIIINNYP